MKFLLDVNLPSSLCQRLSRHGHEASHVGRLGLWKTVDETVFSLAESRNSTLLTHDLGFGKLLAFSQKNKPSIVIFRLERLNASILERLLMKHWSLIERPLSLGAIVVIEENDVRIRRLPIGEGYPEDLPGAQESPAIYRAGKPKTKQRKKKTGKKVKS